MAVSNAAVTVGTSATPLVDAALRSFDKPLLVEVFAEGDIYLGGAGVTTSGATKGRKLAANTAAIYTLNNGDKLYAVAAAAQTAIVLQFGA